MVKKLAPHTALDPRGDEKGRYTKEQIAYALRQVELGTPVVEVVRKMDGGSAR